MQCNGVEVGTGEEEGNNDIEATNVGCGDHIGYMRSRCEGQRVTTWRGQRSRPVREQKKAGGTHQ